MRDAAEFAPALPDARAAKDALARLDRQRRRLRPPPTPMAPRGHASRVHRLDWGVPGVAPEVSVLSIRHHRVPAWWSALVQSVAAQRDLAAWELVSVENFDNALTLGEAWQLAFERACGDHVFFLGDDDWVEPDALGTLLGMAEAAGGATLVQTASVAADAHGKPYAYQDVGGLGLARADAVRAAGGVPCRHGGELDELALRLLAADGAKAIRATAPFYGQRLHRAQASAPDRARAGLYAAMDALGYATTSAAPPRTDRLRPPPQPPRAPTPMRDDEALETFGPDTRDVLALMHPLRAAAALAPAARDARVIRHAFGDPATNPEASVVTIHHYPVPTWWDQMLASVAGQRGLRAWELLEVQNFDNAFSLGEARNEAVARARAPWVFILDDDDWLHPDALGILLDAGEREGADRVACDGVAVDEDGRWFGYRRYVGLGLLRRDVVRALGGYQTRDLLEDAELNIRWHRAGYGVHIVDAPLYYYRTHHGQISTPLKEKYGVYGRGASVRGVPP